MWGDCMSKKNTSGKAMPILSIVFFGVGLILFALKAAWAIAARVILSGPGALPHALLAEFGKSFGLAFPAVFFIIAAAAYLKKSERYKKLCIVAITAQIISCVMLMARLIYANQLLDFQKGKALAYILCALYFVIGVLCFIAAIKTIKEKNARVFLILAGCIGIIIGICLAGQEIYQVVAGFAFYGEHVFLIINKLLAAVLYFVSFTFYYIAFIFSALYKNRALKESEKVKVVLKK